MAILGWRELTKRNIKTIQDIMEHTPQKDRAAMGTLAYSLIKDDRFDTATARWNAFQNALRIVSEGFFGGTATIEAAPVEDEDEENKADRIWRDRNYPNMTVEAAKALSRRK